MGDSKYWCCFLLGHSQALPASWERRCQTGVAAKSRDEGRNFTRWRRPPRTLLVQRACGVGSLQAFPVLLLLRQLSAAQLVNKPGGRSFRGSWHRPGMRVHGCACARPFVSDATACWDLADVRERSDSPLPPGRQRGEERTGTKRASERPRPAGGSGPP